MDKRLRQFALFTLVCQVAEVYESVILVEFEEICHELVDHEDQVLAFLDYVEKTWIGRRLGRTRKKPLFAIASWNHHNSVLSGKDTFVKDLKKLVKMS